MDTTKVLNFFKKAAKNLASGVAGAVTKTDKVKLIPAIAPIPMDAVDKSYGTTEPIAVSYTHLPLPTICSV